MHQVITRIIEMHADLANALRVGRSHFECAEAKVIHDSSEKKEHGDNWKS